MNKDRIILSFKPNRTALSEDVSFSLVNQEGVTPYGFNSITSWIEGRKASKHNSHLREIMNNLGCEDNEGFIRLTHAVGINDTFWVKNDKEDLTWNDVSLFRNQFSDVISQLAFEGTGLYEDMFSSTSPELSCEGSFRKCFRKEHILGDFGSDIYLYKRGGEIGEGLEPYCEALASEIAQIIAPSHSSVKYDLCKLHGKLASKCNIFTNENIGYVSYSKIRESKSYTFDEVRDFYIGIGCEQSFRELLVVDSLCFNQDRHSGNYGVLFNNDTMEIIGMAPVFDLNLTLIPYAEMSDFNNIGDKLLDYSPKLGNDFTRIGQIAMNDVIRDRLKDISDFSFSFRGDDIFTEERVRCLENIVHKQAEAILSGNKLQTKDVFLSQKALNIEQKKKRALKASNLMYEFDDRIESINDFDIDTLISVCDGTDAVQLFVENNSYMLIVDFLNKKTVLQENARTISINKLIDDSPDFYKDVKRIVSELKNFLIEKDEITTEKNDVIANSNRDSVVKRIDELVAERQNKVSGNSKNLSWNMER